MTKRSRDSPLDETFEFAECHFLTIVLLAFLIALIIMLVKVNVTLETEPLEERIKAIEQKLNKGSMQKGGELTYRP